MKDIVVFVLACMFGVFTGLYVIPKRNPYKFPKPHEIDKYNYIDDNGVCYKYVRKYI